MRTRSRVSASAIASGCAVIVMLCAQSALAQVTLTANHNVKVHKAAGTNTEVIKGLSAGEKVTLLSDQRQGSYFRVRLADNREGWIHGKYLDLPETAEMVGAGPEAVGPEAAAGFPTCGSAHHYRWKQKTSTTGLTQAGTGTTVHGVLGWAPLPFHGKDILSWCQDRAAKEKKAFTVTGWVRRTRKEADGDVHIEITQGQNDAVGDCVVVEIPPAELSTRFDKARNDLATLLSVQNLTDKDFASPTRVKFTGLAFWDGWHAGGDLPVGHGRCNSTKGAAWELHGVFKVVAP